MRFEPVFLPGDRDPFRAPADRMPVSQTFLRHYASCPRSGWLYLLHRDDPYQAREMVRGSAFHEVAKRATALAIQNGEVNIPPDVAKTLAQDVLSEMPVVWEDHDLIREMSYRWAAQTTFDPSKIIACETLFAFDNEGYSVRSRVDYAEILEDGAAVRVVDWKTSRSAQSYDEISRKRPDGTIAAKAFQVILYAIELAFGHPVREEDCVGCEGSGRVFLDGSILQPLPAGPGVMVQVQGDPKDLIRDCRVCGGKGTMEFPEPFSLAANAQRFELEYVFPSIEDREGNMVTRSMSLTRLELLEYRDSLFALLDGLTGSEDTGDWPAVVSDQACNECPSPHECPIPKELRDYRGAIETQEQAAEAFTLRDRLKAADSAWQKELRAWVKEHGSVVYGEKVAEIAMVESDRIPNKDAMFTAMERAAKFGEPFDKADHLKTTQSFQLKTRALTADELEEMSNNNGGMEQ